MKTKKTKQSKTPAVSVSCKGTVNVKLMNKNKIMLNQVKHNAGMISLFHGIALCLTQSNSIDISKYLPNFLGVGQGTSDSFSITNDDLINPIPNISRASLSTKLVKQELTGYSTTFTAVINGIGSSTSITELGLYGDSNTNSLLARVQLDEPIIIPSSTVSLIVEWKISIENK